MDYSLFYSKYSKELEQLANDEHSERVELAYRHAKAFVKDTKRVSISGVQRALRIGYNQAAHIVERMEAEGLVSQPEHNGARHVLDALHSLDVGVSYEVDKKKKLLENLRDAIQQAEV